MTIVDEMIHMFRYEELQFVEFLDFIGRVAEYKYQETSMTLYEKILETLKLLFKQVKCKVLILSYEVEEELESDEEYYEQD